MLALMKVFMFTICVHVSLIHAVPTTKEVKRVKPPKPRYDGSFIGSQHDGEDIGKYRVIINVKTLNFDL